MLSWESVSLSRSQSSEADSLLGHRKDLPIRERWHMTGILSPEQCASSTFLMNIAACNDAEEQNASRSFYWIRENFTVPSKIPEQETIKRLN